MIALPDKLNIYVQFANANTVYRTNASSGIVTAPALGCTLKTRGVWFEEPVRMDLFTETRADKGIIQKIVDCEYQNSITVNANDLTTTIDLKNIKNSIFELRVIVQGTNESTVSTGTDNVYQSGIAQALSSASIPSYSFSRTKYYAPYSMVLQDNGTAVTDTFTLGDDYHVWFRQHLMHPMAENGFPMPIFNFCNYKFMNMKGPV